ncbi:MAG: putative Ig domain-containing protein [Planctomycetes bacterium]|nr:putative Ig domain-containing protein [Planctomycetota bacterium]
MQSTQRETLRCATAIVVLCVAAMFASPAHGQGAPTFTGSSTLPDGQPGTPYSTTITVSGGASPYTFSVNSGTLPPLLTLNAASGVISGTPTSNGDYSFQIRVTDSASAFALNTFSIHIGASGGAGSVEFPMGTPSTVSETAGSVTFTARRSGGTAGSIAVSFSTSDGGPGYTANAGSDYVAASGTLVWSNGEGGDKTFTVTILDDADDEQDEQFTATLTNPTGGAVLGVRTQKVMVLMDDENPGGQLTSTGDTSDESNCTAHANGPFPLISAGAVLLVGLAQLRRRQRRAL